MLVISSGKNITIYQPEVINQSTTFLKSSLIKYIKMSTSDTFDLTLSSSTKKLIITGQTSKKIWVMSWNGDTFEEQSNITLTDNPVKTILASDAQHLILIYEQKVEYYRYDMSTFAIMKVNDTKLT